MQPVWMEKNREALLQWLSKGVRDELDNEMLFYRLCNRLEACEVPIARASLHLRIHHPQWLGSRTLWFRGESAPTTTPIGYNVTTTEGFLRSPFRGIIATGSMVRQRLQIIGPLQYPLFEDLRRDGYTDYLAYPLDHTQSKRHLVTFATRDPMGFKSGQIEFLTHVLELLSLLSEIRLKNELARTLLQTYVGPHASEQILEGATTRGSGVTLSAAVMICDLRDFTSISDRKPRDELIDILNNYFDAITEPLERNGGEILKFIGDGLMAVFPLDRDDACDRLLEAVHEATLAVDSMPPIDGIGKMRFGTGIHVGEVMYGNIGSKSRLDFTVIGPAVNIASRLQSLTKELQHPVLISSSFANMVRHPDGMKYLGLFNLRGTAKPIEVYSGPPSSSTAPERRSRAGAT